VGGPDRIAPDILDRVLDPFFTTKEAGEGIGMGLATVNAIVTRHEGAVRVSSKPEMGTRVDVYFPLVDGKPAASGSPTDPRQSMCTPQ